MKHMLPPLPYYHASLEPHVDARTMTLHHDQHHASYVANLNSALEKFPELHERTALWLLLNLSKVPEPARTAVRNNAGGHVNHSLFWRAMSPAASGAPAGPLADAIKRDFGGFEQFKARFDDAGAKLFGSGWVWLARAQQDGGGLRVYTTPGHDNPLMQGHFPILVNDVWEHAYYLKHENRRGDYLKGWWPVVDWEEAARPVRAFRSFRRTGMGGGGGTGCRTGSLTGPVSNFRLQSERSQDRDQARLRLGLAQPERHRLGTRQRRLVDLGERAR